MKVIVAGSRGIDSYGLVCHAIRFSNLDLSEVVSGTARGVDRLGERYGHESEVPVKQFPADWDKYGKRAGYVRNEQMAEYADALVAIWDGESRGTKNMIELMEARNKPVFVYKVDR